MSFFEWIKRRENAAVLRLIAIDNFDLTRKIVIFFSSDKKS